MSGFLPPDDDPAFYPIPQYVYDELQAKYELKLNLLKTFCIKNKDDLSSSSYEYLMELANHDEVQSQQL